MLHKSSHSVFLGLILFFQACNSIPEKDTIDLAGEWAFQIDSTDIGINEGWFTEELDDAINLPGSMLTNGKGDDVTVSTEWTGGMWDSIWYKSPEFAKYRSPGNIKISFWLQPSKYYVGSAWYQKKVIIPARWANRYTEFFLERCHWESTLWVDTNKVGVQNALSAPHIYDLSKWLTPGEHTLTLRIDNRIKDIDPGRDAHSVSDNTQTNWNGIIGEMRLTNRPAVYIDDIQLYPDIDNRTVRVLMQIKNSSGSETDGQIRIAAALSGSDVKHKVTPLNKQVHIAQDISLIELEYPMSENVLLWDEFEPNIYILQTEVKSEAGSDICYTDFGMKKFKVTGTRFSVNERPVFLRGTLECCIFPKTGFPSVEVSDWMHIYKKCKEFGLNHVRFHSWCPPEAAFIAADRMGIYLSVENSAWANVGAGQPIDNYIYAESNRIVKQFGNHPSFCMMPYGNEASGDSAVAYLTKFVRYWQEKDNRRVYTSASGFPECPASDYTSSGAARIQWWNAGLTSPINANPPTTDYDWTQYIEKSKPTVSHEIGQWCVYPDFGEIADYDGVLKPKNFEIFRDRLEESGIAQLADSFLYASGRLQVLCYKADIEAALRTPGFAGFQLLDLHDFPGQGTALVGVLNPFWEEKGYVTAEEFKRFCNETVPLLRLSKMIFLNNEEVKAKAELFHYGIAPLENAPASWRITSQEGGTVAEGQFPPVSISDGLTRLGEVNQSLEMITRPAQLQITVTVGSFENSWDIWVYPVQKQEITGDDQIMITQVMDKASIDYLNSGGSVLLTVKKGSVKSEKGGNVPVGFSSIFWNTQWTAFRQPPFTLGILCDPRHPALSEFPTENHSNYQWWDAMSNCNAINMKYVAPEITPLVRIIDDWFTARSLALIFECRVGKGKLLVSGVDLLSNAGERPEAVQLLYSLKKYMSGSSFNPVTEVDVEKITALLD